MKNRKFRKNGKKQEALSRIREERERIRTEILTHAEELAAEMNLRLLLETETQCDLTQDTFLRALLLQAGLAEEWQLLCDPGEIFFVEDIAVTEIRFPEKPAAKGFLCRACKKAAAGLSAFCRKTAGLIRRLPGFSAISIR